MRLNLRRRNFLRENILYLKEIEGRLKRKRIRPALYEAENLIRHFGAMSRIDFYTGARTLSGRARHLVQRALRTRLGGTPLPHILKQADFCGRTFYVSKDTLIPRPETEIIVEEALGILDGKSAPRILDVGTGCGCIAICLTLARPDSRMTALDISPQALEIARKNLKLHGLEKRVQLLESDLFSGFGERQKGSWDLIVSNPPYVPREELRRLSREVRSEPRLALDGGPGGLELVRALLEKSPYFLKKDGWLLVEIGKGHSQLLAKKLLKGGIFKSFRFVKDLAGIERILIAQKR